MMSCGWFWIYGGLALMLLELAVPGFVLCFFGLAGVSVGVLWFAFGAAFGATWQLAAFSVLSVLYILLLRRYLKKVFVGEKDVAPRTLESDYLGRLGRVVEAIEPPKTGRILLGDAEWSATADVPLAEGVDIRVISQNNLTMKVEAV